jgi:cytochrome c peroxidase
MTSKRKKALLLTTAAAAVTAIIWVKVSPNAGAVPGLTISKKAADRRSNNLSDDELKPVVASFRQRHELSDDPKPLIAFGAKLFFDKEFSANSQVSCATCHDPGRSFTDGKVKSEGLLTGAMNAPTLINSYASHWFFWNGRADSLAAQALGPIESPKEHGFSRSKVLARIQSSYRSEYESIFGKIPDVPSDRLSLPPPAQKHSKVSSAVAAYALATLGSETLQKTILRNAQTLAVQPVEVLKTMSALVDETPTAFEKIPLSEQHAINQVFANFGRAVAAFERTIRTEDSAFDLFADRLAKAAKPEDALGTGFGEAELRGLRLFTGRGNCALCHHGPNFTDQQFHNIGLMALSSEVLDLGRAQGLLDARDSQFNCRGPYLKQDELSESCRELDYIETESAEAVGGFKTPTLRNLKDTAPYGHDGRFPSLDSILQHYNHLAVPPAVGRIEESLVPLKFSAGELKDLEAFMLSLNSPVSFFREGQ